MSGLALMVVCRPKAALLRGFFVSAVFIYSSDIT